MPAHRASTVEAASESEPMPAHRGGAAPMAQRLTNFAHGSDSAERPPAVDDEVHKADSTERSSRASPRTSEVDAAGRLAAANLLGARHGLGTSASGGSGHVSHREGALSGLHGSGGASCQSAAIQLNGGGSTQESAIGRRDGAGKSRGGDGSSGSGTDRRRDMDMLALSETADFDVTYTYYNATLERGSSGYGLVVYTYEDGPAVGVLEPGGAAASVGIIEPGDQILYADGTPCRTEADIVAAVAASKGYVVLTLGRRHLTPAAPSKAPPKKKGGIASRLASTVLNVLEHDAGSTKSMASLLPTWEQSQAGAPLAQSGNDTAADRARRMAEQVGALTSKPEFAHLDKRLDALAQKLSQAASATDGCPNSSNPWHQCTAYCRDKYGVELPALEGEDSGSGLPEQGSTAATTPARKSPMAPANRSMTRGHGLKDRGHSPSKLLLPRVPSSGVCDSSDTSDDSSSERSSAGGQSAHPTEELFERSVASTLGTPLPSHGDAVSQMADTVSPLKGGLWASMASSIGQIWEEGVLPAVKLARPEAPQPVWKSTRRHSLRGSIHMSSQSAADGIATSSKVAPAGGAPALWVDGFDNVEKTIAARRKGTAPSSSRLEDLIGPKPLRSWQSEWIAMGVEQARLDGEDEAFAQPQRYQVSGEDSISATIRTNADEIKWKIMAGWAPAHAEAHTLISVAGVSALARALRARDSCYAASSHALAEAFASRARKLLKNHTAVGDDTIAPCAFCNLHGRFGLSSVDPAWGEALTANSKVGTSFLTTNTAVATASVACFREEGGFGVPVMRHGSISFEPQDSPVVCFVSTVTTREAAAVSRRRASTVDGTRATGRSLVRTSASSYDLPPLATVVLEACVPSGLWRAYGRKIMQPLYVVSVSYTLDASADKGDADDKRRLADHPLRPHRLVKLLKADPELASRRAEIETLYARYKSLEIIRKDFMRELETLVGRVKLRRLMERRAA